VQTNSIKKGYNMKRFLTLFVLSLMIYTPQSQAGFLKELAKDLSMIGCGPQKKAAFDSVVNNQDPSKPQIWSYKIRKGQLVQNPDPRRWFTKFAKEDLKAFCWEARKSRYVRNHRLQMFPAVSRQWYCGEMVYRCMVSHEGGDNDDRDEQQNGNDSDSDDADSDDGDDSDDGGSGSDPDSDDGGSSPPDNF
jgi:hypothetical protein